MKRTVLILLLSLGRIAIAQNTCMPYTDEDIQNLFTSTTKVALLGNEEYDAAIKNAVEQYWTITKVEYFNYADFVKNKMYKDKSSSFLLPFVYHYFDDRFKADDIRVWNFAGTDLWLSVVMGGRYEVARYSDYSVIAYAPIDNYANEMHMFNCSYRLGLMVKGMQDAIMTVKNKSMKAAPLNQLRNVLSEMSKKAGMLKTKTLLVNENLIKNQNFKDKFSLTDDALKAYKFNYKVVPQSEIEAAIRNKDKQYCYLCPVFYSNKSIFINDLETGEVIYGTYAAKGLDVTKDDISKLNAAVSSAK
jgi:hypothetical protein